MFDVRLGHLVKREQGNRNEDVLGAGYVNNWPNHRALNLGFHYLII